MVDELQQFREVLFVFDLRCGALTPALSRSLPSTPCRVSRTRNHRQRSRWQRLMLAPHAVEVLVDHDMYAQQDVELHERQNAYTALDERQNALYLVVMSRRRLLQREQIGLVAGRVLIDGL